MDFIIKKEKLFIYAIITLSFLMMVFIAQLYLIKIILISIILILINRRIRFSTNYLMIIGVYIAYGIYGTINAFLNATDYPLAQVTTTIIWPLLFLVLMAQINKQEHYEYIIKTIFLAHSFIVFYDLIFAFSVIFSFPFPNIYTHQIGFSFYGSSSRMNFVNLNTLTFTTPLVFILWISKYNYSIKRIYQTIIIILTFFLLILSGRRSLMGMSLLLPIIVFASTKILRLERSVLRSIKKSIVIIIIAFILIIIGISITNPEIIEGYWAMFIQAFNSSIEPVKFAQSKMLLEEFQDCPIFGHGFGATFYEPSPGRQLYGYQFELQYHLILAQAGIIGLSLLLLFYGLIIIYGLKIINRTGDIVFFAILIGLIFMMIAHATNPVLCSFDLMLSIYLSLSKINTYYSYIK